MPDDDDFTVDVSVPSGSRVTFPDRVVQTFSSAGSAQLKLTASGGASAQASGVARLVLMAGVLTGEVEPIVGTLDATLPELEVSFVGTYTPPPADPVVTQVWTYLSGLSVPELLVIYGWLYSELRAALQDPETSMYSALITLPFLALVLRALNRRRKG